jgi:hypothetical protein
MSAARATTSDTVDFERAAVACEEAVFRLNVALALLHEHTCTSNDKDPDDTGGYDLSVAIELLTTIRNSLRASLAPQPAKVGAR